MKYQLLESDVACRSGFRGAARLAPSPGACWTGCWRQTGRTGCDQRGERRGGERGVAGRRPDRGRARRRAGAAARSSGSGWAWRARIGPMAFPVRGGAESRMASPFQLNPLGLNPLRDLLAEIGGFRSAAVGAPVRLLIAATRVRDGHARLFREHEVTLDAVLASACLPFLQHAVEIEGEAVLGRGLQRESAVAAIGDRDGGGGYSAGAAGAGLHEACRICRTRFRGASGRSGSMHRCSASRRRWRICEGVRRAAADFRSELCRKLDALRFHEVAAPEVIEGPGAGERAGHVVAVLAAAARRWTDGGGTMVCGVGVAWPGSFGRFGAQRNVRLAVLGHGGTYVGSFWGSAGAYGRVVFGPAKRTVWSGGGLVLHLAPAHFVSGRG